MGECCTREARWRIRVRGAFSPCSFVTGSVPADAAARDFAQPLIKPDYKADYNYSFFMCCIFVLYGPVSVFPVKLHWTPSFSGKGDSRQRLLIPVIYRYGLVS